MSATNNTLFYKESASYSGLEADCIFHNSYVSQTVFVSHLSQRSYTMNCKQYVLHLFI